MIPISRLPHTVTVIDPAAGVDEYGNPALDYGPAATRTPGVRGLMQQHSGGEVRDRREATVGTWLLVTNHLAVGAQSRLEWEGATFEVTAPPAKPGDYLGRPHHAEVLLRVVEG